MQARTCRMPGDNAPVVAAAAGAQGAAAAGARPAAQGGFGGIIGTILRMGVMWYVMNMMKGNKQAPPPPPRSAEGSISGGGLGGAGLPAPSEYVYPAFERHALMDLYLFISEQPYYHDMRFDMSELVWSETGLHLASNDDVRKYSYLYEPSEAVQRNGSVYVHVVLAKAGEPLQPDEPGYDPLALAYYSHPLNSFRQRPRNTTGVKLLSENPLDHPPEDKDAPREVLNYIKPNVTIQVVDYFAAHSRRNIPQQISDHMRPQPGSGGQHYLPLVHFNEFWMLKDKLVPVNESLANVTVHLEFGMASMTWWQLLVQMEQSFKMQVSMGMSQDGESDELKRVFLEGNPYLLGLTFVVSMLHTVFDLLAFKNDIGFWKNNRSMEGLSARTVLINAFCQFVILLYLFDNDTSFVVLMSSVLGTGIEIWKVTKAFDVKVTDKFPFVSLTDRASYSQKQTKQYDAEAMRYLSYALYPLVIGYSIYSLAYKSHKSWYSWILSSLVGAVYMFGFILMCPQLYLNYKLKSVAHLPWRQMTYKFLNTIIDDLFAFVIKMPLLHRLSVFRDDVIFLIYLYQRYTYRVDKTRANEFGWSEEQPPEAVEAAAAEGTGEGAGLPALPAPAPGAAADEAAASGSSRKRKGAKDDKAAASGASAPEGEAAASGAAGAAAPEPKKDK